MWSQLGLVAYFQGRADDSTGLLERAHATIPEDDGYGRCLVAATGAIVDQLSGRSRGLAGMQLGLAPAGRL